MPIMRNATSTAEPLRTTDGRLLYQCDNCGSVAPWDDNWAWFGSYRQHEDFGLKGVAPILTICSDVCRIKMVATNRLPHEGLTDEGKVVEDDEAPKRAGGRTR